MDDPKGIKFPATRAPHCTRRVCVEKIESRLDTFSHIIIRYHLVNVRSLASSLSKCVRRTERWRCEFVAPRSVHMFDLHDAGRSGTAALMVVCRVCAEILV